MNIKHLIYALGALLCIVGHVKAMENGVNQDIIRAIRHGDMAQISHDLNALSRGKQTFYLALCQANGIDVTFLRDRGFLKEGVYDAVTAEYDSDVELDGYWADESDQECTDDAELNRREEPLSNRAQDKTYITRNTENTEAQDATMQVSTPDRSREAENGDIQRKANHFLTALQMYPYKMVTGVSALSAAATFAFNKMLLVRKRDAEKQKEQKKKYSKKKQKMKKHQKTLYTQNR